MITSHLGDQQSQRSLYDQNGEILPVKRGKGKKKKMRKAVIEEEI
jgi:hypothetical protein